jgi:predicted ATPase/DNA-binding winged helix-turn-helix (wHTH) protein
MTVVSANGQAAAYRFGRVELLPAARLLRIDGKHARLGARAFDLLLALVERRDRFVSKDELLQVVWPKLIVEENNIEVQISTLRKLLGPQAIATVPGRGYRFTLLTPEPAATTKAVEAISKTAAADNLPIELSPLYGRINDVVALERLLERHRLVSVVGPAGIGKTRVAEAVAHGLRGRNAHGVWIVELAALSDSSLVAPTVARTLGQVLAAHVASPETLAEALADLEILLVLDNCEHLLDSIAELVMIVIGRAPRVRFLVTSQEPLHVPEEHVSRLGALTVPAVHDVDSALSFGAVELFVARAEAADPAFRLTAENIGDVVEICSRLDGIALAIELAAARVPLLGTRGVRQRLDERFRLLSHTASRAAAPRHRALQAALDWRYMLLSAEARAVFDRVGVFVGGFSLEAAQQVASDDAIDAWGVLDLLAALVDKSLVIAEAGDEPRYRLLESSRAFALDHLAQAGQTEQMRRRHAQAIAETLESRGWTERRQARLERIWPDLDNVRAAAAWATGPSGDRQIAIALAGATVLLWDSQGCNDEGARLYRQVEPWIDEQTPPLLAGRFWYAVSELRLFVGLERQAQAGLKAVAIFEQLGDRHAAFLALASASERYSYLGDGATSATLLAQARGLLDEATPPWAHCHLEQRFALLEFFAKGDPDAARRHAALVIELAQRAREYYQGDSAELILIMCDYAQHRCNAAVERALRSLQSKPVRDSTWRTCILLATLGASLSGLGRLDEAEAMLREAVPRLKRATGSAAWAFNHVALLLARRGRLGDAAQLMGYLDASRTTHTIIHSPSQRRSYDDAMQILKQRLDPTRFEQLHTSGLVLTEDQAAALAFS